MWRRRCALRSDSASARRHADLQRCAALRLRGGGSPQRSTLTTERKAQTRLTDVALELAVSRYSGERQIAALVSHLFWTFDVHMPTELRAVLKQHRLGVVPLSEVAIKEVDVKVDIPFMKVIASKFPSLMSPVRASPAARGGGGGRAASGGASDEDGGEEDGRMRRGGAVAEQSN